MEIRPGGVDVFYLDESGDAGIHILTAVRVPFIRAINNQATFVWKNYLDAADAWRRTLSKDHAVLFRKELHGVNLMNSRDRYHKSGKNLEFDKCVEVYKDALAKVTFLPPNSIFTVSSTDATNLLGWRGLQAAFMALMQRLRTHCDTHAENTNGMIFFDDGHNEYVRWFRRACVHLPTGSNQGGTNNIPLSMFVKDGNFKKSEFSYFVQIADLVGYAALQKLKFETAKLTQKRVDRGHHTVYDCTPHAVVNLHVTRARNDGIARI